MLETALRHRSKAISCKKITNHHPLRGTKLKSQDMIALFILFSFLLSDVSSDHAIYGFEQQFTYRRPPIIGPLNEIRGPLQSVFKSARYSPTLRGGFDSGVYESVPEDDPMTPREIARSEGSSHYSNGIYSLCTPRHSHVSYYGFMFNVRAKAHPIVITGIK